MTSLDQGALVASTNVVQHGHRSRPNVPIAGAPDDADLSRFAVLHDGTYRRLYTFAGDSTDTLYQFAWDGERFRFGHESVPELILTNLPDDADSSSIAMLHTGTGYRAYLRRLGDPTTLYQFAWVPSSGKYDWGHDQSLPTLSVSGFDEDVDWDRWQMFHDGSRFQIAVFHRGLTNRVSVGSWNSSSGQYEYGHECIPELDIVGFPPTSRTDLPAMFHDGKNLRCCFLAP